MAEVGRDVAPAIGLRDVVMVMDVPHGTAYLNRYTYELVTISESDLELPDWGDDDPEFREYQKRQVARARKVVKSEDFLKLPGRFEIRELDIMQSFCSTVENLALRDALLKALRGRDAFKAFSDMARERGVQVDWFKFREQALERVAADWLDANGIAYRRD